MKKLEAVFFDLDGTLINTLSDIANSFNYALKQQGLNAHEIEEYKYFVGNGIHSLAERICGDNSDKVESVKNTGIEHYNKNLTVYSEPYLGIVDAVEVLKSRGIILAVLTNKPDDACKKIISAFFPKNMFSMVCGMKEGMEPKPDTEFLLQMCKELDVDPSNCMFVGDSSVDMLTAKNADMVPVGVEWGFRTIEELEEYGASVILEEPADISSLPEIFEDLDD